MQLLSKLSQRHSYYLISSFTASACSINPWQWNKFTYHIRHRQRSYMLHRPCGKQLTIKSLSEFWNLQSICWFKYFVLVFGFCVWLDVKSSVRKKSTLLIKNSTFSEEARTGQVYDHMGWLCHILSRNKKKKGMVYSILLYTSLFSSDCVKTLCFRRTDHVFCWRVTDLYICAQNQQSDSKRKFSLLKMSKIIIYTFLGIWEKKMFKLIISVFEFFSDLL